MKSIILMCAAVIITTSAFAGNITANNSNQNSIIKSELFSNAYAYSHSSYANHAKRSHHELKQIFRNILRNPFRIVKLNRSSRY